MNREQTFFLQVLSDFTKQIKTKKVTDVDWFIVTTLAKKHDLLPIVAYQCKEIYAPFLNLYSQQISRYVHLKREIERLRDLLIDFTYSFEKGACISEIYPIPALRTMGDIDILVSQNKREELKTVLVHNGYTCEQDEDGDEWKFKCELPR